MNQVLVNQVCSSVPAGFYRPLSASGIYYACAAGYYSNSGSTSCTACSYVTDPALASTYCDAWPSTQPSSQPTRQPTMQPSSRPTRQPTNPTGQPSRQPTGQPSSLIHCSAGAFVNSNACSLVPAGCCYYHPVVIFCFCCCCSSCCYLLVLCIVCYASDIYYILCHVIYVFGFLCLLFVAGYFTSSYSSTSYKICSSSVNPGAANCLINYGTTLTLISILTHMSSPFHFSHIITIIT